MTTDPRFEEYAELRRRFGAVVEDLTAMGTIEDADYLMAYFFIFFHQPAKLRECIDDSERMLRDGEW